MKRNSYIQTRENTIKQGALLQVKTAPAPGQTVTGRLVINSVVLVSLYCGLLPPVELSPETLVGKRTKRYWSILGIDAAIVEHKISCMAMSLDRNILLRGYVLETKEPAAG